MKRLVPATLAFVLLLACGGQGVAGAGPHTVAYDHFKERGGPTIRPVHANAGEVIELKLENSIKSWKIRQTGILRDRGADATPKNLELPSKQPTPEEQVLKAAGLDPANVIEPIVATVLIAHLAQYGGYVVTLEPGDGSTGEQEAFQRKRPDKVSEYNAFMKQLADSLERYDRSSLRERLETVLTIRKLSPAQIIISVQENDHWALELAGGFTASGIRQPFYAVSGSSNGGVTTSTVQRLREKEGKLDKGMGAMIHVYNTRHPWCAATFGLATGTESAVTYFPGVSLRLGGVMWISLGAALGQQAVLPGDLREGSVVTDPNALTNLPTKPARGWFAGLSFAFLSPGEPALKKPFNTPDEKKPDTEQGGGR